MLPAGRRWTTVPACRPLGGCGAPCSVSRRVLRLAQPGKPDRQLVGLVAGFLAAAHYLVHLRFTMDDAAITFAYARSFAEGEGLGVLTPGSDRVEGYSHTTWLLL